MPLPPDDLDPVARLVAIMAALRDPATGCPWDREQDFGSIAPYTIEEAYEVADAIERRDWTGLKGELGDLLFQAVYHARLAEEAGLFSFADVAAGIGDKMIARHPHVFGDGAPRDAAAQTREWEAQKARERAATPDRRTLDGVALALPALKRAAKLQARAARVGFDWPDVGPVLDKIAEEAAEVAAARHEGEGRLAEEVGDLLFVVVNLARHLGVEPEGALRAANAKFERRFRAIEDRLGQTGRRPEDSTLEEMDAIWNEVRARDREV